MAAKSTNLMRPVWGNIDSADLRLVLDNRIGGGQFNSAEKRDSLFMPNWKDCKVILRYDGNRVSEILAGKRFEQAEWEQISSDLDSLATARPNKVARDVVFSSRRFHGYWCGSKSGVQIMSMPDGASQASVEDAQHPFVLEVPIIADRAYAVSNLRRRRKARRMALLLNLLLLSRISCLPRMSRWTWVTIQNTSSPPNIKEEVIATGPEDTYWRSEWLHQSYNAWIGDLIVDASSEPVGDPVQAVAADIYYSNDPRISPRGFCVPDDLDESICAYLNLKRPQREQFDRSLYWLDQAFEQWDTSMSMSYASLVSAVETLTPDGQTHSLYCKKCGKDLTHDAPSLGAKFREFFERYAPGYELQSKRGEIYKLRSSILHGSKLIAFDEDTAIGWDSPWDQQNKLHGELWQLTRLALRNYLRNPAPIDAAAELRRPSWWRRASDYLANCFHKAAHWHFS